MKVLNLILAAALVVMSGLSARVYMRSQPKERFFTEERLRAEITKAQEKQAGYLAEAATFPPDSSKAKVKWLLAECVDYEIERIREAFAKGERLENRDWFEETEDTPEDYLWRKVAGEYVNHGRTTRPTST